jgi:TnpA family transposase
VQVSSSGGIRRKIHERLNVLENWNSANGFVFIARAGIATNRIDEQEISVLAAHLLQVSLITRMLRTLLVERDDYRGLTPLIYKQ